MNNKNLIGSILLFFIFLINHNSFGQTSLSAGDLAIVGIQSDTPDKFSFVLLKDIEAGTVINFTDKSWLPVAGTFRTGEGIFVFTADQDYSAGSLISSTDGNLSDTRWSPNVNGISGSGDSIIAYQESGGVQTFIFAAHTGSQEFATTDGDPSSSADPRDRNGADDTNATGLPPGLTDGVNAVAAGSGPFQEDEFDNIYYDGITSGTPSQLLAAISNDANWVGSNTEYEPVTTNFTISGVTVTWDGSEGNDWSNADNWSDGVPQSFSDVTIPSGLTNYPTVTTAETINSLTVSSGGTLVATNASFTVTNDASYTRNLSSGSQWYLMSSPVSGENYDDAWVTANSIPSSTQDTDNRGISWYNNASSDTDSDGAGTSDSATGFWRYMEGGDDIGFTVGRGYGIIRSSAGNIEFVGSGIYTSNQTFTLAQGVNNFNLIGNPFTAYITLGTFHTTNSANIGTDFYFWNGSSYDTRTSGLNPTFEIAPGQGYFVEASSTNNVTFEVSDLSHQGTDTFQKSSRPEITLNIEEGKNTRYVKVFYIDGTTKGYDNGYDGKLFGGVSHSFALYSDLVESDGNKYQLQSLPNSDHENMVVPIGVIAASGKEITFTAEALNLPSGLKVFLEDRELNTITRLDETKSEYKVTLDNALNGTGRFYLHTTSSALSVNDINLEGVNVFTLNRNTLRINGINSDKASLKLFNILGKNVLSKSFSSKGVSEVNLPNLSTGVYIIQLSTEKGKTSKKIVLE